MCEKNTQLSKSKLTKLPVIYLAGGMHSNWQDTVKKHPHLAPYAIFIDPRDHGSKDPDTYTQWDLNGVANADIVFGFLEKDTPGGQGLCVEFGMAYALGKQIIFVKSTQIPESINKYLGMAEALADVVISQKLDDFEKESDEELLKRSLFSLINRVRSFISAQAY